MEISVAQQSEPTLADVIGRSRDVLRRRWKMFAAVMAAIFIVGVVVVFSLTPKYSSQARVRIDPTRDPVAAAQGGSQKQELSDQAIDTEVSAFYSLDLAKAVVRDLNLTKDPELAKAFVEGKDGQASDPTEAIAKILSRRIGVYREGQTYVLGVEFTSSDRVKAADIANSYAENYIRGTVGSRTTVATEQAKWYQEQLLKLSGEVRAADAAAARFRIQNGLTASSADGFGSGTIVDQQVPALTASLAEAKSAAAAARANYSAAVSQASRSGVGSVSEVLGSQVIANLQAQRAAIINEKEEINKRYGSLHPQSVKIAAQLNAVNQQIATESKQIVASLGAIAAAADARANSLAASLNQLQNQRSTQTEASVIADSLDREADAKRELYKQLTEDAQNAGQAAQNSMSSASIVDRAVPAEAPSSPNKPLFLALSLLAGMLAGVAVIAIQEILAGTVRDTKDVEEKLGLRLLSVVPRVDDSLPADTLIERPTSFYAESLRIARTAIAGSGALPRDQRVLAFSSAVPGEGKTTTSLGFARTMAVAGVRTLIIDCDIRRASLWQAAHMSPPKVGLVEVLKGEATAGEAVIGTNQDTLDMLLVKSPYFASTNLFEGGKMRSIVEDARDSYDCVILDLPPLMGLADGRALAELADLVTLIVRWDSTPIKLVQRAVDALRSVNKEPVGAIINSADERSEVLGGGYYYSRYSYYYEGGKS